MKLKESMDDVIKQYLELPLYMEKTKTKDKIIKKLKKSGQIGEDAIELTLHISEFLASYNIFFISIYNKKLEKDIRLYMYHEKDVINFRKMIKDVDIDTIVINNFYNNIGITLNQAINGKNIYHKVLIYLLLYEIYIGIVNYYSNKKEEIIVQTDIIVDLFSKKISLTKNIDILYKIIKDFQNNIWKINMN